MAEVPEKEGQLKKRGGRMHQWSSRYFMLTGSNLSYKTKKDSTTLRGSFDLVPGCVLTEVVEESTMTGKKMYNFWIVWPHDKTKRVEDYNAAEDSDDENDKEKEEDSKATGGKAKDLQKIVETEVMTQKRQKDAAEEQIDKHQAHDSNVSLGMKVAAVAVGGVVVGALTAGIGLVPYMTVVGITAAAGGGAVAMQFRGRPQDSRIIIACDSMNEALEWKTAIERQINRLEGSLKPMLPSSVDPKLISSIIDKGILAGSWKRVAIYEGMRIMEHVTPGSKALRNVHPWVNDNDSPIDKCLRESACGSGAEPVITSRCCKAQMAVSSSPINTFLTLMNSSNWPQHGSIKVVREIDDHADYIGVEIVNDCSIRNGGGHRQVTRKMCFSRFWKLEDDGVYLITLNSTKCDDYPASVMEGKKKSKNTTEPSVDAVITIAPRNDVSNFEFDIQEAMVTCICQVSMEGNWQRGEETAFMEAFLKDHLLELKQSMLNTRFVSPLDRPPVPTTAKLSASTDEYGLPYDTSAATQRAPSAVNSMRLSRRGITTVQPGLEDATPDAYNHTAINNSHGEYESDQIIAGSGVHVTLPSERQGHAAPSSAAHQTSPPMEKKKKSLFSRVAGTSKNKTTDVVPEKRSHTPPPASRPPLARGVSMGSDEGRHASPPLKNNSGGGNSSVSGSVVVANESSKSSPVKPSKKRDKKTNIEVTHLRNQMLAAEYELTRSTKSLRKKVVVSSSSSVGGKPDKHHISQEEYSALQSQHTAQEKKLQELKNKYTTLTGEAFMAPKSTFSRLRTFGRGNSVPINTANIVASEHSSSSGAKVLSHQSNTSPTGGVAEGSSYIFHTDGKGLKAPSLSRGGSTSTGTTSEKNPIPANQLRPSHWATNRSPGMRMESNVVSNAWTSLFTEPQDMNNAKSVQNKNVLIIVLCIVYMTLCGGIGYAIANYRELMSVN